MRRSCLNVGRANFLINLNIPKICYRSGEKTFAKFLLAFLYCTCLSQKTATVSFAINYPQRYTSNCVHAPN
jgi:hypothetical protein